MHLYFMPHLNRFLIFILISYTVKLSVCRKSQLQEFYSKSTLQDGVHELVLYFDGIRAKESVVGPKEESPRGIVAREISNGKQVVNLIYNGIPPYLLSEEGSLDHDAEEQSILGTDDEGLKIRECRVEKSPEEVNKFVEDFDRRAVELRTSSELYGTSLEQNRTYVNLNDLYINEIPSHVLSITKFKTLKQKCFSLNRKVRKIAKSQERERLRIESQQNETSILNRNRRGLRELLILPGTKWCGNGRLAKSYNDLDGYMVADHCCRAHDLCPSSIPRFSRKFGLYNYRLTTISHCSCDKRHKRGVTNLLSVPNTKWCGQGYSAKSYDELGGLYGADSCCRQHDLHCPFFIQSFERKYGYFHFGLGTLSHCSCDRRFKTCLKQIGTGAADVVGNVFFSLVKASCFDFEIKKVCKKRGFWSCLRWGHEKQAVIRNPIPWNT